MHCSIIIINSHNFSQFGVLIDNSTLDRVTPPQHYIGDHQMEVRLLSNRKLENMYNCLD